MRVARWLAADDLAEMAPAPAAPPSPPVPEAWAEVCEQFAWRLLVLTEQLRPLLDGLENGEEDPDRLAQLYQVDHGVTRMRRVARDLRVLTDRGGEELAGHTTSLLDVIRMAASAIDHYGRVSIGPVAELAVVPYAADDVASLLAALTDNATRYSPAPVTVSAHLLGDGSVMLRVEDAGLGIDAGWLAALNNALAGPVPAAGALSGRHTGFAVVHRLARRQGLRVQLARRDPPGTSGGADMSGTIAMVIIPAPLLCEIPDQRAAANGQQTRGQLAAAPAPADLRTTRRPVQADSSRAPQMPRPQVPAPQLSPSPHVPPPQVPSVPQVPSPPQVPSAPQVTAASRAPQDRPDSEQGTALPRREPRSVRTPVRPTRPEAAVPGQRATPDPATEGLAFADDLRSFSAALEAGEPAGTEAGEDRPGDGKGHQP